MVKKKRVPWDRRVFAKMLLRSYRRMHSREPVSIPVRWVRELCRGVLR